MHALNVSTCALQPRICVLSRGVPFLESVFLRDGLLRSLRIEEEEF